MLQWRVGALVKGCEDQDMLSITDYDAALIGVPFITSAI